MHMIWILAALVAAPTAPPDKGVDPKDKVIDPAPGRYVKER